MMQLIDKITKDKIEEEPEETSREVEEDIELDKVAAETDIKQTVDTEDQVSKMMNQEYK